MNKEVREQAQGLADFLLEHDYRKYTALETANIILDAGYRLIKPESLWVDEPTKRGEYWMSAFIEGRYIAPCIISVIDYQRPDRGLEVQHDFPHETVPVKTFVAEYYPQAKWMFINEPKHPAHTKRELGE